MEFFKKGELDDYHEDGFGEQAGSFNYVECMGESKIVGKAEYQLTKVKRKTRSQTFNTVGKHPNHAHS